MSKKSNDSETKTQARNVPTLFQSNHEEIVQDYIDSMFPQLLELTKWIIKRKNKKNRTPLSGG